MTDDYSIRISIGRAYPKGKGTNAKGRLVTLYGYQTRYRTNAGEFSPEEWKEGALREIRKEKKEPLLEKIKNHCREHCAWLSKEQEIEEYAISCLCNRAYEHWGGFETGDFPYMGMEEYSGTNKTEEHGEDWIIWM